MVNALGNDINAKSWSKGPDLPTARGALTATAHENKIYAIGGAKNPTYSTPELRPTVPVENMATNEVLDIATGTWSAAAPMLTARNHHGASLIDSKIYVVGGRIGSTFIIGLSNNAGARYPTGCPAGRSMSRSSLEPCST